MIKNIRYKYKRIARDTKNKSKDIENTIQKRGEKIMKMKQKNTTIKLNGGITLIALVITIIVLLILARSSNSHTNRR